MQFVVVLSLENKPRKAPSGVRQEEEWEKKWQEGKSSVMLPGQAVGGDFDCPLTRRQRKDPE